ncbi:hypothetical protein [Ruminiclostridium cellobioparum]|jgi:hypothetical protein|uniref:hypothetical protein n=1 Tax=Ruminiclostridium cellobioparum TaxID=29355 RepID=UPI0028A7C3B6|nr:hypothetical protein [Ruminiclostridium cellobioparum]
MKLISKIIIVLFVGIILELGIFNFDFFKEYVDKSTTKNIYYTLDQMEVKNWTKINNGLISEEDPMLFIKGVNTKVKKVKLEVETDKPAEFILLFYTTESDPIFTDSASILYNTDSLLKVDKFIKDLRIDIGDKAGIRLKQIKITINPLNFNFSISRIIAVLIIYLLGRFLLTIQQSPDYDIK